MDTRPLLSEFFSTARTILATPGAKPESSLYSAFETLLGSYVQASGRIGIGFVPQAGADAIGIPDWRVNRDSELLGWVELKASHKGLSELTGHDLDQRRRFVDGLTNVIVTNGWQWEHYQDGRLAAAVTVGTAASLDPSSLPVVLDDDAAGRLDDLLASFFESTLSDYGSVTAAVTALAVRARALRNGLDEVGEAGAGANLLELRDSFQQLVFRNGQQFGWKQFVDSYVQIAVFGALLWRLESQKPISLDLQVGLKHGVHPLLYQCLKILWSADSRPHLLEPVLEGLVQTINLIPVSLFERPAHQASRAIDPIVHAYEPFFAVYDSKARDAAGVYYTPVHVVEHIVSGIEAMLIGTLHHEQGLLDPAVRYLDPATGTGTFILGLARAVSAAAESKGWPVDVAVSELITKRVAAFELLPGPYTIAHQRMETLLESYGAPPEARLPIYLTDTLAAPETGTLFESVVGGAGTELLHERQRADQVKTSEDVLVVLGNPPYERLPSNTGLDAFARKLLDLLLDATPMDHRQDLKSARDLFVAFWLWAMWVLQPPGVRQAGAESPTIDTRLAHGITAFITNRTWIQGRSLRGLRAIASRGAREIWVLDLGGDSRGADGANDFGGGDENVFDIQTGVAIVWLVFDRDYAGEPIVRYRRIFGKRAAKYLELGHAFDPSTYATVGGDPAERLTPVLWDSSALGTAPLLSELWEDAPETGFQTARDKSEFPPIGVDRADVFAETQVSPSKLGLRTGSLGRWASLKPDERRKGWATAQSTRAQRVAPNPDDLSEAMLKQVLYRPLDYRWLYDDPVWVDWYREDLQRRYGSGPVPTLITNPRGHGAGPAAIHTSSLPDQHSFNNRGGKGIWNLWHPEGSGQAFVEIDKRTIVEGRRVGFSTQVIDWLEQIDRSSRYEDAYSYILAFLTASEYVARNWRALDSEEPRVPLTDDSDLFDLAADLGGRIRRAWELHAPASGSVWGGAASAEPLGKAAWANEVITFDNGRTLARVPAVAWQWRVSGYRVLENWLKARASWRMTTAHAQNAQSVVDSVVALVNLSEESNVLLRAYPPETSSG